MQNTLAKLTQYVAIDYKHITFTIYTALKFNHDQFDNKPVVMMVVLSNNSNIQMVD